jgi:hypothetical protein
MNTGSLTLLAAWPHSPAGPRLRSKTRWAHLPVTHALPPIYPTLRARRLGLSPPTPFLFPCDPSPHPQGGEGRDHLITRARPRDLGNHHSPPINYSLELLNPAELLVDVNPPQSDRLRLGTRRFCVLSAIGLSARCSGSGELNSLVYASSILREFIRGIWACLTGSARFSFVTTRGLANLGEFFLACGPWNLVRIRGSRAPLPRICVLVASGSVDLVAVALFLVLLLNHLHTLYGSMG